ncbi:MAG: hypothetical protein ACPL1G_05085 [Thermodesulfovibrionales bacterium]
MFLEGKDGEGGWRDRQKKKKLEDLKEHIEMMKEELMGAEEELKELEKAK